MTSETPRPTKNFQTRELDPAILEPAHAILLIGGDGTVMDLLPALALARKPVIFLPGGNESLAARYCGMTGGTEDILARLARWQPAVHHLGMAHGRLFFTMVSCGLDAEIIERIARRRSGPIGHIGYVRPTFEALLSYRPPRVTLAVDGRTVIRDAPGYCIIANNPAYARGLDPVPEAATHLPELTARFYPRAGFGFALAAVWSAIRSRPLSTGGSELLRGRHFELSTAPGVPIQADGELLGTTPVEISRSDGELCTLA